MFKPFPRDDSNKPDYSGYKDEEWPKRDVIQHKTMGEKWLNQWQTKKMREAIEFEHGVRYT